MSKLSQAVHNHSTFVNVWLSTQTTCNWHRHVTQGFSIAFGRYHVLLHESEGIFSLVVNRHSVGHLLNRFPKQTFPTSFVVQICQLSHGKKSGLVQKVARFVAWRLF